MNVVPLRARAVSLNDISGFLRKLADDIDAGDFNDVETLLILAATTAGELHSRCLGHNPARSQVVGLFQMAAIKTATGGWG